VRLDFDRRLPPAISRFLDHLRCRPAGSPRVDDTLSLAISCAPGDTESDGAMVADQPAREADQARREGRQPRSLCRFLAGRGGGVATDVRRDPVANRSGARTGRARISAEVIARQAAIGEVCAGVPKSAPWSALVPSIGRF
jgi:hypothetical protein